MYARNHPLRFCFSHAIARVFFQFPALAVESRVQRAQSNKRVGGSLCFKAAWAAYFLPSSIYTYEQFARASTGTSEP